MTSFPLRLPDFVMDQARAAADEEQVSINQLLTALIAEGIGRREALKEIRERAKRADVIAALAVLDRVPNVPPEAGDAIIDGDASD